MARRKRPFGEFVAEEDGSVGLPNGMVLDAETGRMRWPMLVDLDPRSPLERRNTTKRRKRRKG